jgi:hypothetical protein
LTHLSWHKIAPRLAEEFTVVATDLRGYGDPKKPPGGDDHSAYSFRAMAQDQIEVMAALGFKKKPPQAMTAGLASCTACVSIVRTRSPAPRSPLSVRRGAGGNLCGAARILRCALTGHASASQARRARSKTRRKFPAETLHP